MEPQQLIGFILIPPSLMGVVCNGLVVIATWKSRSLNHSFSLLTANQALFSGGHSMMYLFFIMPMYVLDIELLKTNSHHIGFILLLCSDVSLYTHSVISINRLCAVFFPIAYRALFDSKSTKIMILLIFLLSLSTYTVFFIILPCRCSYNPERWSFSYNKEPICGKFAVFNASKIMSFALFNVIVDLITIAKVRRTRSLVRRGHPTSSTVKKKDIDLLKQSFFQSLLLLIVITGFYTTPKLTTDKMIGFIVGNVGWCLLQALDGAFTIGFNSQIRKALQKKQLAGVIAVATNDGKSDRSTPNESARTSDDSRGFHFLLCTHKSF